LSSPSGDDESQVRNFDDYDQDQICPEKCTKQAKYETIGSYEMNYAEEK